ncbi:multidrug resistance-associated protein 1-like [Oppia nitens]|uniref:multidrug resistance-associated protein 1-like n=1 Tax=Oppia nitens TaxID=1686743 RepID=UPI0023DC6DC5|nr:multidrug resistance-associated protein 1-like [Oppia nitens]
MSQFCTSSFWDWDISWNSQTFPDFTICFEETVLTVIPCLILLIISCLEIPKYCTELTEPPLPYTTILLTKFGLTIALILINLIDLLNNLLNYFNGDPSLYFISIIKILTFSYVIILQNYHRKHRIYSSGVLFIFWILYSIASVFNFRTIYTIIFENESGYDSAINEITFVTKMLSFPIVIMQLIFSCVAELDPYYEKKFMS